MIRPGNAVGSSTNKVSAVLPNSLVRVTKIPTSQPKKPQAIAAETARKTEFWNPSITRGLPMALAKLLSEIFSSVNGTPGAGSSARYAKPTMGATVIINATIQVMMLTGRRAGPSSMRAEAPVSCSEDAEKRSTMWSANTAAIPRKSSTTPMVETTCSGLSTVPESMKR